MVYRWADPIYGLPLSTCSDSTTLAVVDPEKCVDQNGATASNIMCDGIERPAAPLPQANYTGCNYIWAEGGFSDYSTTCGTNQVRTQIVQCQRSGGDTQLAIVTDGCDESIKPRTQTDPVDIISGCTHEATYGPYGACVDANTGTQTNNGIESAPVTSCLRSDGETVDNSRCEPQTRTCTITYTATYGEFGHCARSEPGSTTGTRTAQITSCVRSTDGVSVSPAKCAPKTESCTPTYATCGTMTPSMTSSKFTGLVIQKNLAVTGATKAIRIAAAIQLCQTSVPPNGGQGVFPYLLNCATYDRGYAMDVSMYYSKNPTPAATDGTKGIPDANFGFAICTPSN